MLTRASPAVTRGPRRQGTAVRLGMGTKPSSQLQMRPQPHLQVSRERGTGSSQPPRGAQAWVGVLAAQTPQKSWSANTPNTPVAAALRNGNYGHPLTRETERAWPWTGDKRDRTRQSARGPTTHRGMTQARDLVQGRPRGPQRHRAEEGDPRQATWFPPSGTQRGRNSQTQGHTRPHGAPKRGERRGPQQSSEDSSVTSAKAPKRR